jgi:starch phosphorylase
MDRKVDFDTGGDFSADLERHYAYTLGRDERTGDHRYLYEALVLTLRDRLEELEVEEMDAGPRQRRPRAARRLLPRQLRHPALPVKGYGIRYEYGMFHQLIERRLPGGGAGPLAARRQPLGIRAPANTRSASASSAAPRRTVDEQGRTPALGGHQRRVSPCPTTCPIPGYRNDTVNTLRLWRAEATDEFDLEEFNAGSYTDAVAPRRRRAHHHGALPNDAERERQGAAAAAAVLPRLASLQDVIRAGCGHGRGLQRFAAELLPAQRHAPDGRSRS